MRAVTARAQHLRASSPTGWWPAPLVLGLLIGLFGMHGLAPGGTAVSRHPSSSSHSAHSWGPSHSVRPSAAPQHADPAVVSAERVCHGGGDGRGHAEHADPTCSSGAVGAGPLLPVPALDPTGQAVDLVGSRSSTATGPEGGRAPPSLAELQLLRI
ncbi:DUF6153 family protein [Streptomyces sp. NPDC088766]|uniref:DUF6153 family protein n=1 Tax=Streptomyces sp. NPDC088766 TaxID=3365893 RepID=UPI0038057996